MKPLLLALILISYAFTAGAAVCEFHDGDEISNFAGASLDGIQVEKKSMILLNNQFPILNVIEKAFKGDIQTCSSCSGRFVSCK
jgi:hypothetical protein